MCLAVGINICNGEFPELEHAFMFLSVNTINIVLCQSCRVHALIMDHLAVICLGVPNMERYIKLYGK